MTVTFERQGNGFFRAFVDGIQSKYYIINGDLGTSGTGRNMYGVTSDDPAVKVRWIGSLQKAKKTLAFTLGPKK